ncbi:MAG: helix-turn-helix transcriptional regulator [Thermodesulfobacteriota bacterium]|nr:MAG: helix-turn-helix transcriptional regulator [Thermodesulfobacteriota bacterium]
MIQFHFRRLLEDKEFRERRSILLFEIAEKTGLSRVTLSKIAHSKGNYKPNTEIIEKLCLYFECTPNDLMTIIPEEKRGGKKLLLNL